MGKPHPIIGPKIRGSARERLRLCPAEAWEGYVHVVRLLPPLLAAADLGSVDLLLCTVLLLTLFSGVLWKN